MSLFTMFFGMPFIFGAVIALLFTKKPFLSGVIVCVMIIMIYNVSHTYRLVPIEDTDYYDIGAEIIDQIVVDDNEYEITFIDDDGNTYKWMSDHECDTDTLYLLTMTKDNDIAVVWTLG